MEDLNENFTTKNIRSRKDNDVGNNNNKQNILTDANTDDRSMNGKNQFVCDSMTVLQIAYSALGMVSFASEQKTQVNKVEFNKLIQLAVVSFNSDSILCVPFVTTLFP